MSKVASCILDIIKSAPRFRGRNRAIKHLLNYTDEANSFYGPKLTVRPGDNTFYASYFARYGHELVDIINTLPKDGVFLDFGANAGIFSLVAAHHLVDGDVISIEPNSLVFRDLVNNKRINKASNMMVLNLSIGQHTNKVPFKFDENHTGKGHISESEEKVDDYIFTIKATEFAKLLPDISGRSTLCKIDTEGSEILILQALISCGMIEFIDKFYIEIDDRYLAKNGHSHKDIYDILLCRGFTPEKGHQGKEHYDEVFLKAN